MFGQTILFDKYADASSISCHQTETRAWTYLGTIKRCIIDRAASIPTLGYQINSARDETVEGFDIQYLITMFYLPDSPSEQFPYLQGYSAYRSSVKEISHANFKNLKQLRMLWLSGNQIEKINSNTFNDLESLEWLYLGKQKSFKLKILLEN
jgi:hypothetical protein